MIQIYVLYWVPSICKVTACFGPRQRIRREGHERIGSMADRLVFGQAESQARVRPATSAVTGADLRGGRLPGA